MLDANLGHTIRGFASGVCAVKGWESLPENYQLMVRSAVLRVVAEEPDVKELVKTSPPDETRSAFYRYGKQWVELGEPLPRNE